MFHDYCLKFTDEASACTVLNDITEAVTDDAGNVICEQSVAPRYANIDIIGTISKPTGEVDADGLPILAPIDGWHVNVRTIDPAPELNAYTVQPANSVRVWG